MTDSNMIDELLDDRRYHIEFNGHLTNHAKHAVVALAGLGASPRAIKAYYDNYARLTPYGHALEAPKPSRHEVTEATWERLFGKRTSFSAYCDFFDRREQELGMDELLRRYLPPLLPGWVGSFTHATIHLGWALGANHRWMTIEGLAYMAFSYVSCNPERAASGHGRFTGDLAVDSLLRIAAAWDGDRDALRGWIEGVIANTASGAAARIHPELARSGLQYRIARLLGDGHPLIYELPAWIEAQDTAATWDQLYYAITLLYLTLPGDFVFLHLITSLHAMEQIAARLPANHAKDVLKCFWVGMLCIIFSRADFPAQAKLAGLHATHRDALDLEAGGWEQIIARAVQEEEEHNPKLVYVLQRVWKRSGGCSIYRVAAAQFTTTPQLPRSFEEPPVEYFELPREI